MTPAHLQMKWKERINESQKNGSRGKMDVHLMDLAWVLFTALCSFPRAQKFLQWMCGRFHSGK